MSESERKSRHKRKLRARGIIKFLAGLIFLAVVSAVILSFVDIGGNIILSLAKNHLSKNYNLNLYAENITGNPIKGYTLNNCEVYDSNGEKIFSVGKVSAKLNLRALLTGKIRLKEISVGGVNMDIDKIDNIFRKLDFDNTSSIPEYINIYESKFYSGLSISEVKAINFDMKKFDIDIDAAINGVPVKGVLDFSESENFNVINRSDLELGSGKILATGGIFKSEGENKILDFHASIQALNLSEVIALDPLLLDLGGFDGIANLNIDITGEKDNPKISGNLDYNGKKFYGFPIERLSANLDYSDNVLNVSNLQASALTVPIQGGFELTVKPYEDISVVIKLDGSETNLEALDKILDIPEFKTLTGKIDAFNANISGTLDELNGLINFSAPKISYQDKNFTNIKTQIKFAQSSTASVNSKFNFEGSQGYLQGNIESFLLKPVMNLTAKLVGLDVKRIEDFLPDAEDYKLSGKINSEFKINGRPSKPVVSGSINSPEILTAWGKILKPVMNFSYSDNKLAITKTEGTFNGMPVNATGTLEPFPSVDPNLNINASLTMNTEKLKNYFPETANYAINGLVNAGFKITGSLYNPVMNFLAESENLQAANIMTLRGMQLITDENAVNISAREAKILGANFSGLEAKINNYGDEIVLDSLTTKGGAGMLEGEGTFSISKSEFTFKAEAPSLYLYGFMLDKFTGSISGNLKNVIINNIRAKAGESEIIASGNVRLSPSVKVNVSLNGENLKLERLLQNLHGNISGSANLVFNFTGSEKNLSGKGSIMSNAVNFYGLKLTNINLPLTYSGNNLISSSGSAKIYGGNIKNFFSFDTLTEKFTDNIEASGFGINSVFHDFTGLKDGKVSGTGKFSLKISGNPKSYSGTGNFSTGSGNISGFDWQNAINSNMIKFSGISAPLALYKGNFIIKSGAIINSEKNETLYKYAKLIQDTIINLSDEKDDVMNLIAESSLNSKIIDSLEILKDNAKSSDSSSDFKIIKFKISGKPGEPSLSAFNPDTSRPTREQVRDEIKIRARDEIRKSLRLGLGGLFQ